MIEFSSASDCPAGKLIPIEPPFALSARPRRTITADAAAPVVSMPVPPLPTAMNAVAPGAAVTVTDWVAVKVP